ncbi:MAG: histidinol dehydrogenase [Armatimonadetes bacterium RBG_16_58_9]|nr:MAG: histidinol dehydrogenase [Armatimonadetes bacterium RBG_16_58_9]
MKIFETVRDPMEEVLAALSHEASEPNEGLRETVRDIIRDVKSRGDEALLELGRKFDSPRLEDLRASEEEFEAAHGSIKPELLDAIRAAKSNIEAFHRKQLRNSWVDMREGFVYGQVVRPIEKVGFYAPAGLAPLLSTVLMTAVPANLAGVSELVMCCPVQKDGNVHGAMLVAARECGVSRVCKVGGAQAIAAMAFGTDSVPKVDKIVGPGNAYVTEAKRQVFGYVGIDQLAGPSDILVLADNSANPGFVAADMISQAEHGPDSPCVLITDSRELADGVLKELKKQTESAVRREYVEKSLEDFGVVVIARDINECIDLANTFAPEHLELALADPWEALKKIKNAGAILLGHYSPVPLGDFAAGPNHTLPTGGTARFSSALGVDDFIKKSELLCSTKDALKRIAPTVLELAEAEGLDGHAQAVRIRTK